MCPPTPASHLHSSLKNVSSWAQTVSFKHIERDELKQKLTIHACGTSPSTSHSPQNPEKCPQPRGVHPLKNIFAEKKSCPLSEPQKSRSAVSIVSDALAHTKLTIHARGTSPSASHSHQNPENGPQPRGVHLTKKHFRREKIVSPRRNPKIEVCTVCCFWVIFTSKPRKRSTATWRSSH